MLGGSGVPCLSGVKFFLGTAGGGSLEDVGSCVYLEFVFFSCTFDSSCEILSTDANGVWLPLPSDPDPDPDPAAKLRGLGLTGGGGGLEPANLPRGVGPVEGSCAFNAVSLSIDGVGLGLGGGGNDETSTIPGSFGLGGIGGGTLERD